MERILRLYGEIALLQASINSRSCDDIEEAEEEIRELKREINRIEVDIEAQKYK